MEIYAYEVLALCPKQSENNFKYYKNPFIRFFFFYQPKSIIQSFVAHTQ